MKLCCFFNYPPLYRSAIFRRLDETFDCRFYFGRTVEGNKHSGIEKLDFSIFKHRPVEYANIKRGRLLWRRKLTALAFKNFDTYLLTWDTCLSYPLFILLAHMRGKKVYAWGHGVKSRSHAGWPLDRWLINHLDGYFTYGSLGRQRMIELGFPEDKLHVVYNSLSGRLDPEELAGLKNNLLNRHFENNLPTVLFVGRLTAAKQIDMIITTAARHRSEGTEYNVLIIGDGNERGRLEQLTADLGMSDRVWFYGACHDETTLNKLIYNCDLCCSPGNVGLTALHAMTYGVPVISHDDFESQMPEYETITKGVTGTLFRKGDVDDYARKVAQWLSGHSTDESREQVRRDCLAMINDKWNADNQIDIFKSALCQ